MYTMTETTLAEIMDLVYVTDYDDLIPYEVAKDYPIYTYEEVIAKIDAAIRGN
jgi:hypothetical protein